MSGADISDPYQPATRPVDTLPPAELRHVQLVVCGMAADADEARDVLDALGLLP